MKVGARFPQYLVHGLCSQADSSATCKRLLNPKWAVSRNWLVPVGNFGNQMPGSVAGDDDGSHRFPSGSQVPAAEKPCIYAAVPTVPTENEQVCGAKELTGPQMARQVSRWIGARCTRTLRAWAQRNFCTAITWDGANRAANRRFPPSTSPPSWIHRSGREMDGWQAVGSASDEKSFSRFPERARRVYYGAVFEVTKEIPVHITYPTKCPSPKPFRKCWASSEGAFVGDCRY